MSERSTTITEALSPGAAAEMPSVAAHPWRCLGAFRLVLALLVLVSHSASLLSDGVAQLSLGNVGVLLFFVVSGFVVSEALDLFYRGRPLSFLANRALKIWPAYLATLPLAYAALWIAGKPVATDPFALLVNASLALGWFRSGNGLLVISVAWAVLVELQFYLLAAVVFAVGRRVPALPALAAFLALAAGVGVVLSGANQRFYGTLQFAPFFVTGALGYFLLTRRDRRLVAPLGIATALSLAHFWHYNAANPAIPTAGLVGSTLIYALLLGAMAVLVGARLPPGLERIDKRLGDLTYALYLVHPSAILLVDVAGLAGAAGFATVLVSALAGAALLHLGVERSFQRLRDRLRGRRLYD